MRGRGKREQRRHVHYIPQFENESLPLLLVECHKCASRFSFGPYYQSLPHCCCQDLICIALSRLKGRGSEFPLSSGVVEMEMEESGENGAVQAKMVQNPMACTCIFRDLGIRVNGPRNEVWKFQQGTKCSSSNKVRSAVPTKFAVHVPPGFLLIAARSAGRTLGSFRVPRSILICVYYQWSGPAPTMQHCWVLE